MSDIDITVFRDPGAAKAYLAKLAQQKSLWVFDVETYDRHQCPSRKGVATDPCHPDHATRGIAFAHSATAGAWVELAPWDNAEKKAAACALLSAVFGSPAPKGGFAAHFDEQSLCYSATGTPWVRRIRNRCVDGMLAAIALGDVTQDANTLAQVVKTVFGQKMGWEENVDKARIIEMPLDAVARGGVHDAVWTFRVILRLYAMAKRGEYLPSGNKLSLKRHRASGYQKSMATVY